MSFINNGFFNNNGTLNRNFTENIPPLNSQTRQNTDTQQTVTTAPQLNFQQNSYNLQRGQTVSVSQQPTTEEIFLVDSSLLNPNSLETLAQSGCNVLVQQGDQLIQIQPQPPLQGQIQQGNIYNFNNNNTSLNNLTSTNRRLSDAGQSTTEEDLEGLKQLVELTLKEVREDRDKLSTFYKSFIKTKQQHEYQNDSYTTNIVGKTGELINAHLNFYRDNTSYLLKKNIKMMTKNQNLKKRNAKLKQKIEVLETLLKKNPTQSSNKETNQVNGSRKRTQPDHNNTTNQAFQSNKRQRVNPQLSARESDSSSESQEERSEIRSIKQFFDKNKPNKNNQN